VIALSASQLLLKSYGGKRLSQKQWGRFLDAEIPIKKEGLNVEKESTPIGVEIELDTICYSTRVWTDFRVRVSGQE